MVANDPFELVNRAIMQHELDKLLLGYEEYCYLPPWSLASGNTDLTELLAIIYDKWPADDRDRIRMELTNVLKKLVSTYSGLEPVATCILIESLRQARNRSPLGLPIDELGEMLRKSINEFCSKLTEDKTGDGNRWQDGWMGEFRRLSKNTVELGGPSFVD